MRKVFLDDLPRWEEGSKGNKGKIKWGDCIGYKISFIIDDIKGEIEVLDYTSKGQILKVKYNKAIKNIRTSNLLRNRIDLLIGKITTEFKFSKDDIIGKVKILEPLRIKTTQWTKRGYKYKCLICDNVDEIFEDRLIRGDGCNVCSGKKVKKGYNDLYTTHPHVAKHLKFEKDRYIVTYGSHKELIFKCHDCGYEKLRKVKDVARGGYYCHKCSDGKSYPEKFIVNMFDQLNCNYETEKKFNWSRNKRYDFYNKSLKFILETHGKQHYDGGFEKCSDRARTLEEEQENDYLKKELAIQNGIKEINYIVIDSRESNMEWMKTNILNSRLSSLFDLSSIEWFKCHEFACNSLVKSACDLWNRGIVSTNEISKILKLSKNTVSSYLKQGVELSWCDYDPKKVQKILAKQNRPQNNKKIVRLSLDGEAIEYESISDAARQLKISLGAISQALLGKTRTSGGFKWMYRDDYLLNKEDLKLDMKPRAQVGHYKPVVRLDLEGNYIDEFKSITEAAEYFNLHTVTIIKTCKGQFKHSGGFRWMYKEDYINLKGKLVAHTDIHQKKEIVQINLDGVYVSFWASISEASSSLNISPSLLTMVCKGVAKSGGGFMWMYKDDYEKNKGNIKPYKKESNGKFIVQLTLDGAFIQEWESATEVYRKIGINNKSISLVCNGKRKATGGYRWMFKEDYEKYILQQAS